MKIQLIALILAAAVCAVYAQPGSHLKASSATSFSTKSAIDHKIDGLPKRRLGTRNYLERRAKTIAKPAPEPVPEPEPEPEPELKLEPQPEPEIELLPASAADWVHESSNEDLENSEQELLKKGDKNHNSSVQKDSLSKKKNVKLFEAFNKADEDVQQTPDRYSSKKSSVNYVKDYSKKKTKNDTKHRSKQNDHESYKDHSRNLFAKSNINHRRKGLGINESIQSSISQSKEDIMNESEGH